MRLNRVAMDLGLTARKRPKKSQYIVAAPVAKKEKTAMFTTPLTFKDMENVVENRNHEERDFVVDHAAKELNETQEDRETEQMVSDVVNKVFGTKVDEECKEESAETAPVASETSDEAADNDREEAASGSEEKASDSVGNADVGNDEQESVDAADMHSEDEAMNESVVENEEVVTSEENEQDAVPAETEKSGYDLAMDLLRIIRDNADEAALKERYGSKWTLSGMIGTTFDDAKKMLAEVHDYFAFHVGEIVALVSNPNAAAGVVIFVDGDAIGVFDGEKILSYKSEMITKTGKVFKNVMAAGGFAPQ